MTLERQKQSIDKDKGNQTQRRLAIAQNLGRHGASVMVSSRKVSVNLLIRINMMISRIINLLVIRKYSFAGSQCWEGCGAAEVRGAGRRWNGENALILWSLSDRGWNKIKNDHHLSQPSLNSYFDLRSAMLGSRRTEALCWNPQSKGGHFDGKHSCSRYFEHNLQFKPFPRWGGLDILVSNAAVNPYFGPTLGCPEEVGK